MSGEDEFCAELTPRELEVLELTASGYSAKEVASRIGIAPRTVERHVENVRLKMHARNRAHMITQAVIRGVLRCGPEPSIPRQGKKWRLNGRTKAKSPEGAPANDVLADMVSK